MKAKTTGRKKRSRRNAFFYIGGIMSAFLTFMILISFVWTPYRPSAMDAMARRQAPSLRHIFGTDNMGRDIFSRVLRGAGASFVIAICIVCVGCLLGILIGSLCGYFGGAADAVLTRLCDCITAFPAMLLALVVISVVGRGTVNLILVLGILFVPSFARVVRSEFARLRKQNYIENARLMGAGHLRIIFLHILPNTLPVLLPAVAIGFNNAVISEASMSFLGIGIQPPNISLGLMLNDAQTYLSTAPWYALFTGLMIILLILSFSLLGEGIQQSEKRS